MPKVFVGTREISNWISLYANAFKALGYDVVTCAHPHPFYATKYDYNLGKPLWLFTAITAKKMYLFEYIRFKLARIYVSVYKFLILIININSVDIFVFIGDGFSSRSDWDYKFIKHKGKKIIQVCYGGDIRDWDAFRQKYNIDISVMEPEPFNYLGFNEKVFRLRKAELYADAIFSIPDQSVLGIRPYHRLYIPFEFNSCIFNVNQNDIPKIIHIESRLPYKGEKYIYEAIEKLRNEGLIFDFKAYKNLAHSEVIKLLEESDILVDEVMIFGPGSLGHEAIACGCALATKMQDDHFLKNYVCNLDYTNIVDPLRAFIVNKQLRINNLKKCYELSATLNSPTNIAKNMLKKLDLDKFNFSEHSFSPTFLFDGYIPPSIHESSKKNKRITKKVLNLFKVSLDSSKILEAKKLI